MLGSEIVKTYNIFGITFDVYGCWDNETPENEFDFYDVFERESGQCLNEGEPFYEIPTIEEVEDLIEISGFPIDDCFR